MEPKPFGLAVKAFVRDEQGRLLLLKRSKASKHFRCTWELPGGKVDKGEDFAVALVRELAEETGLDVVLTGVVGASEFQMEHVRVAFLFMEARARPGKVRLSSEHDDCVWADRELISKLELNPQFDDFILAHAGGHGA